MSLKERIQDDKKAAMISGDSVKKLLLSTVLGEFDLKSKEKGRVTPELTEDELTAIVRKVSAGCKECGEEAEVEILNAYLPQMYSEEMLEQIIGFYLNVEGITEKKDLGKVMKYLKETHGGKYDGKIASQIVGKKLT